MELILPSIAGTLTLLVAQFMEFVQRGHTPELASSIKAIPRLITDSEALTPTVSVAAASGR
jgi:hypothetical protein